MTLKTYETVDEKLRKQNFDGLLKTHLVARTEHFFFFSHPSVVTGTLTLPTNLHSVGYADQWRNYKFWAQRQTFKMGPPS